MARFATRLTERNDLSVPRGVTPRMGGRYDADAFGRFSEAIARFLGTGRFIVGQTVFVVGWIVLNTVGIVNHWDPYPFILLNLAFSTQAAYAAPLILLAQNRQDDRDRANVERDREVAARTQADTEFLARELAAVRLALADVVTTKDLEDSMERMAKLIADQLKDSPGTSAPPDGQRQVRDGQARRGDGSLPGEPLRALEERVHHVDDAVLLVQHRYYPPLVQRGARVGDAQAHLVAGRQRGIRVQPQVSMLVVEPGHLGAVQAGRDPVPAAYPQRWRAAGRTT